MRGDSPLRFGVSGRLLIVGSVVAVLGLIAAGFAQAAPTGFGARLMAGGSFPVTPRSVPMEARSVAVSSVTEGAEIPLSSGWTIGGPLGSPGPGPADAPFGAELDLSNDPHAQSHASTAGAGR